MIIDNKKVKGKIVILYSLNNKPVTFCSLFKFFFKHIVF